MAPGGAALKVSAFDANPAATEASVDDGGSAVVIEDRGAGAMDLLRV